VGCCSYSRLPNGIQYQAVVESSRKVSGLSPTAVFALAIPKESPIDRGELPVALGGPPPPPLAVSQELLCCKRSTNSKGGNCCVVGRLEVDPTHSMARFAQRQVRQLDWGFCQEDVHGTRSGLMTACAWQAMDCQQHVRQ
jgi:hypothetical protein